jgi:hypothetical protein
MKPPFSLGEPVEESEVLAVYKKVFGMDAPAHLDRRTLNVALINHIGPLRYDFEVNMLRGHAIEIAA